MFSVWYGAQGTAEAGGCPVIGERRVKIKSAVVSETDGQPGKIVGAERGYLVVLLERWQSPMLFWPSEVEQA